MTTKTAEKLYLAQHLYAVDGKEYAVFNPHNKDIQSLPVIYGFNNGGSARFYKGLLISEDGVLLGDHLCSHEGYMMHDLGIIEDSRPDRHETFREHYPEGYRMEFVGFDDAKSHEGLANAFKNYREVNGENNI